MAKRRLAVIISIVLLAAFLSGCIDLREYAKEAGLGPVETQTSKPTATKDLPTLPAEEQADIIPLEVFTSYYEYEAPNLSDDGETLLYRHMDESSDSLIAEKWKTGQKAIVQWPSEAIGVPYYLWAPDGETVLFFVDDMGDENYGLYISNIETGETKTIIKGGDNDIGYVSDNPENDKEIYVQVFDFNRELFDLYLLNYETGKKKLVLKNPGEVAGYVFDDNGDIRLVITNDDNAGRHVLINKGYDFKSTEFAHEDWEEILYWDYVNAKNSGVWSIMPDGKSFLYTDSTNTNTSALYSYSFDTGEKVQVFNHPDYDIAGSWTDLEQSKVTAVNIYSQKNEWNILDDSFQQHYDVLLTAGEDFSVYDSSGEDEYWMVAYTSDVKEMDYYIYDMASKKLKFLYNAQPGLLDYDFAPMEPFSYTSGDGLKIEGYATFPLGAQKQGLPTVMLVHGGPWSRDIWGFNKEVQLLANRGYLVLQVNFRGSTGYGKDFVNAGDMEWGGLMHQDILDAVDYAIDMGWADPERVGVYGASYGGYEALVCAAFSSDVFACAVDAFGPSSLITLVESIPPQWKQDYEEFAKSVGDPKKDAALMKSRSPLYFAENIDIPLLIAQGTNDVRVKQQESDQMVEALKEAGIPVTYLLFEDTGHGFASDQDRLRFYSALENFFAENLGMIRE